MLCCGASAPESEPEREAVAMELSGDRARYDRLGYLEPFALLSPAECERIIHDGRRSAHRASWLKGLHEFDTACTRAALTPTLVDVVRDLLGTEVILWSIQMVEQAHGVRHRWHSDFEALTWPTIDVWIGLRNVGSNSFLRLVEGSHLWGTAPQDLQPEGGLDDDDFVLRSARTFEPTARIMDLPMQVGEALIFDGRLWHGSQTPGPDVRSALLIQYSPASAEPRMLNFASLDAAEWKERRPGCVVVAGDGSTLAPGNLVIKPRPLRRRPVRGLLRRIRRLR